MTVDKEGMGGLDTGAGMARGSVWECSVTSAERLLSAEKSDQVNLTSSGQGNCKTSR